MLIIIENLPAPFDRRVWQEARTLTAAGYAVSIVCPKAKGFERSFEVLDGIRIHRHPLPEARGRWGYVLEYAAALFWQVVLAARIALIEGVDVIHACNPPDTIFLVAALFKPFGVRFVFDHHDLCPELYEAKFNRRGQLWQVLALLERLTFRLADVVISTNDSYRRIALQRGGSRPDRVFVVRSGPTSPIGRRLRLTWVRARRASAILASWASRRGCICSSPPSALSLTSTARARAVLIGDGPQRRALQAEARRLGLADAVSFPGRLSDDAMKAALGAVDVCVNPDRPSRLNDLSTMNKVIEYMALGKAQVQFESCEGRTSAGGAALYAHPGDVADFAGQDVDIAARQGHADGHGA